MTGKTRYFTDRPEPDRESLDLLTDLLRAARLTGSIYMDARLTAPFAIDAREKYDPTSPLGRLRHVSIFHMVTEGTCTVQSGAESVELKAGDAVWMPLGHAHRLSMGEAELCSADVLFRAGNLPGLWEVDHGGGGARTRLI